MNGADHAKLIQILGRFVPAVARGLALGFGAVAVATAIFGMGDYATATDRRAVAILYAVIAVISGVIALAVKPILRRYFGRE